MATMDRAARTQLVADATALHEFAGRLLAARQTARRSGESARRIISSRTFPLSVPGAFELDAHDRDDPSSTREQASGRLLLLRPDDASLLRTVSEAQRLDEVDPGVDDWLGLVTATFPEQIPLAAPQGFFRRLFGQGADSTTQERATEELTRHLTFMNTPEAKQGIERAWPARPSEPTLGIEQIRHAAATSLGSTPRNIVVLPTEQLHDAALAIRSTARTAAAGESLTHDVHAAVAAQARSTATALLADIDMERFRSRVPLTRFPASALERAGIRTVTDLLSRTHGRLTAVDGISSSTASTLLNTAEKLRTVAQDEARIDLTAGPAKGTPRLLIALKAVLDHRLRTRGADHDGAFSMHSAELAERIINETQRRPSDSPYASEAGPAPALLVTDSAYSSEILREALLSFTRRAAHRDAGLHLLPEERERLTARSTDDFAAHGSEYFALLTELGYEDRIAQNTHGDLPDELIQLVERTELDTELLTLDSLRQYQHFAARFIVRQKKVIIGDEMGLGKTVEALAAIAHLTRAGSSHTLVICPAAVLANWIREIESKSSIAAHRLHGADRDHAAAQWQAHGGIAVTTFDTLGQLLARRDFPRLDTVVVDEAHKIKNPAAKRTRHSVAQIQRASHAVLMTGTPIENRLEEFRTLISYLAPSLSHSAEGLLPAAFRRHIAPAYLRRNQEDVLKELPELNEIEDWIEFSDADRRAYTSRVADGHFMGMRRAAMEAGRKSNKVERLLEIVDDATANGRKVIVFSFFRTVIDELVELLPGPVHGPISGSVSAARRQEIVDEFSDSPKAGVLLSQIQAGGEGLNIQAASVVVLCEPQLKPSLEVQAIARAHRMGQKRSVQVHRLLSDEGIDPRIVELLGEKTRIFDEYARESATKDADRDAVEAGEIAIEKRLMAEEKARVLGESLATTDSISKEPSAARDGSDQSTRPPSADPGT
ncbi:DEAD/DEAH box helicase [Brachybacterium sp. SW0106-09]|uniref:DEAD/DEAH box helicase n=1 Tax=Brachybacterium sp. SW0106-09 TaxID=1704590 RepID=UPI0013521065|nr:DEAD/DEAH box helicase [Brachybacterium sp. SW0106-09]